MSLMGRLKRHPFGVTAFFEYSLVLTYALPAALLQQLLPPRLTLDQHDDLGFLAIALVKTKELRPDFLPGWLGRDFFLSGYRIFTRFPTDERRLRGLKIIRSDTDSRLMTVLGNLLTHYTYHKVTVQEERTPEQLYLRIYSHDGQTDLALRADLKDNAQLPTNSPFREWREARKWCGPLPFTFSPDSDTDKMVVVEGVRQDWSPRPVEVELSLPSFFHRFRGTEPALACAFLVEKIPYRWKPGVLL